MHVDPSLDGTCPDTSRVSPFSCLADFPGCDYDVECNEGERCCLNKVCGYKECKSTKVPVPVLTIEPATALTCPQSTLFFCPESDDGVRCNTDSDCDSGELCCNLECGKTCAEGLSTAPRGRIHLSFLIIYPKCCYHTYIISLFSWFMS